MNRLLRKVFLCVRAQPVDARAPADAAVHAEGRPAVHARRHDRGRARRGRRPPGRRHRDDVHEAGREHRRRGPGPGGRRPLPRAAGPDQGGRGSTARSASSRPSWASTSTRTCASATCGRCRRRPRPQGSYLWIDMEDSSYVDRTLDLYQRLRSTHARTGICLQAYLRRTARDVERLLPLAPAVRLVKGAYDEPAKRSPSARARRSTPTTSGSRSRSSRESRTRPDPARASAPTTSS